MVRVAGSAAVGASFSPVPGSYVSVRAEGSRVDFGIEANKYLLTATEGFPLLSKKKTKARDTKKIGKERMTMLMSRVVFDYTVY